MAAVFLRHFASNGLRNHPNIPDLSVIYRRKVSITPKIHKTRLPLATRSDRTLLGAIGRYERGAPGLTARRKRMLRTSRSCQPHPSSALFEHPDHLPELRDAQGPWRSSGPFRTSRRVEWILRVRTKGEQCQVQMLGFTWSKASRCSKALTLGGLYMLTYHLPASRPRRTKRSKKGDET